MKITAFCRMTGCGDREMTIVAISLVRGCSLFRCFVLQCGQCGRHLNEAIGRGVEITVGEKL